MAGTFHHHHQIFVNKDGDGDVTKLGTGAEHLFTIIISAEVGG